MLAQRLAVYLGGTLVGSLNTLPGDRNIFLFDGAYEADPDRPVLSLGFLAEDGGLAYKPESHGTKLDAYFSNLLPEGELRTMLAERAGVHPDRDFPLIEVLGEDLPGAVVVRPAELGPLPQGRWPEAQGGDADAAHADDGRGPLKFSLAGVQLKLSAVRRADGGLTVPASGRGGDWILKLPSETFDRVPENEFAMMRFAAAVGIDAPEVALVGLDEIRGLPEGMRADTGRVLAVRRFDRGPEGRVHTEDFAQVRRTYPTDRGKYRSANYGTILRILLATTPMDDVEEFVRRIIFNAAIGNGDMHLKNLSLIYPDGRTPRLAPAYDLVSTILYYSGTEAMALNLERSKRFQDLDSERLTRWANHATAPRAMVLAVAQQTAEAVRDSWPNIREEADLPAPFLDAVTDHMATVPILNGR